MPTAIVGSDEHGKRVYSEMVSQINTLQSDNLFDQYGHDAHEFLREEDEEASGFLLWHKDKLINRDNEHGGPRYFQLPDIADIKDTFEQYVQSVDAALISQYDTHNINIP